VSATATRSVPAEKLASPTTLPAFRVVTVVAVILSAIEVPPQITIDTVRCATARDRIPHAVV
jgi:hypothetical protein